MTKLKKSAKILLDWGDSMLFGFEVESEFRRKYLFFYIDRFVYSSIKIENENANRKKRNLLEAFRFVLRIETDTLDVWQIRDVGDLINKEEDVAEGFRRIQVSAGNKATFYPVLPKSIIPRLYSLLDNYKNVWCDLSVFEREAMFHIEFMRIHPFEDGNKRIAKTILNRNLIFQNMAPVIIDDTETDLYYKFINEQDYLGFAKFLESKSGNEMTAMVGLYKTLNNLSVDAEIPFLKKEKVKEKDSK